MSTRQLSGYQYNASRNTRVFVQELIVKDNLFLGDNCNLVYGLNSQVSFSKTLETEELTLLLPILLVTCLIMLPLLPWKIT